ncbi:T9SS type A sorting domain-containing protein [Hymenobacter endophyticus]|uniref:T9SS type A sorting domain-containing protein n=1 Tax=Hymenobacter endophyticus TaxID=3076335 RepID=A0ABU3TKH6_9BACT|nr:T9SS type A sorting domain-containing protein [Hymenobacter endophyticus]MDU0371872.1 T9SS type A sorting domain-containing protein [Hymenobacter endophyticus]
MKAVCILRLGICVLLLCSSFAANATHYLAGTITYRRLAQPSQYEVQVILYTDTTPGAVDEPVTTLNCLPNLEAGCAAAVKNGFTLRIPRQRFEQVGVAQCGALNLRKNYYTGVVTLPPNRWTLLVDNVNRRAGVLNINTSENSSGTISATLDNSTGLVNNSPEFVSTDVPVLNGTQYHQLTAKVAEADGDSVAYEFVTPMEGLTAQNCPRPSAGFVQPPHFRLNAITGLLETVPFTLMQGNYVMLIQANEFRRLNGTWTKIGSIQYDVIYTVRTDFSSNRNPRFTALQRGTSTLDFTRPIPINPGQTVDLTLTGTDPDAGQQLRFSSSTPLLYSALYPSVTFPSIQSVAASQARFTWQVPTSLPLGRYTFSVTVNDDSCPQNGREIRAITIEVTNRVITGSAAPRATLLTAYPTPFREQVQFTLEKPGTQLITVFDGLGRFVAQFTSRPDGTVQWQPTATLAPGLYVARTADGHQQFRLLRE